MVNVLPFPMPEEHAISIIRKASAEGRMLLLNPPEGGDWYKTITRLQVQKCLEEGTLMDGPTVDQHGNVICWLERFGAGLSVRLRVALVKTEENPWEVIVLDVENRL